VLGNLQLGLQRIDRAQRDARDRQEGITEPPVLTHRIRLFTPSIWRLVLVCFASSAERGICPAMEFDTPCACATLRRAARAVTAAYDAALAPSGLRITQFSILRRLARLGPLPVTRLAAEAALDRSTMGRNLNPLERRGLVRIKVGNADQRERIACLTAAGEAAIAAALPHWRKAQKRIAALVQPSAIAELANKLDALAVREQGRM
jgi:DNA-binding MarR family transcriptional regulator